VNNFHIIEDVSLGAICSQLVILEDLNQEIFSLFNRICSDFCKSKFTSFVIISE